jgi:HPt (histidine-containing phosphotransfer) domain-containing protein
MPEQKGPSTGNRVNFQELLSRVDDDRELLRDLLSIFTDEFPRHFQALREAVAAQDTKQIVIVGHTMKGMLSNLAVTKAAALAGDLEHKARAGEQASLKDALAAFEQEVEGLLPEMEGYKAEVPS